VGEIALHFSAFPSRNFVHSDIDLFVVGHRSCEIQENFNVNCTDSVCDDCHRSLSARSRSTPHSCVCELVHRLARPCVSTVSIVVGRNLLFDVTVEVAIARHEHLLSKQTVGLMPCSLSVLCLMQRGGLRACCGDC